MNRMFNIQSLRMQCGASMVELGLILPMLMLLLMGSLEFPASLKTYQSLTSLSREAASAALRECEGRPDIQACLDLASQRVVTLGLSMSTNVKVTTSMWKWDGANCQLLASSNIVNNASTRLTSASFENATTQICSEQGMLATSEVTANQNLLFPLISSSFGFSGGEFYAVSIF